MRASIAATECPAVWICCAAKCALWEAKKRRPGAQIFSEAVFRARYIRRVGSKAPRGSN